DEAAAAAGGGGGLDDVGRAEQRDAHGVDGVLDHGVDAGDRSQVDHQVAALDGAIDGGAVHDVADDQLHAGALVEVGGAQRVAPQGVEHAHLVAGSEAL